MSSSPVQLNQRIQYLDVLRGFAIIGVLFAYISWNLGTEPESTYTILDKIIDQTGYFLIDSKCYTLLAALFTIGFVMHMNKSHAKTKSMFIYRKRLFGLLILGLLHMFLLRNGDILTQYSILTFIVTVFYNASRRTIIIAMIAVLLLQVLAPQLWVLTGNEFPQRPGARSGNYLADNFAYAKYFWTIAIFYWETTLFLLLTGLLVGKILIEGKVKLSNRQLTILAVSSFVLGSLSYLMLYVYSAWLQNIPDIGKTYLIRATIYQLLSMLHKIGLASAYAITFFWLVKRFRLSVLANLGRMSLTNYLSQAIFIVPIGIAFNLFDHITPTKALIMFAAFFTLQIAFNSWWLKHFQFGPLEWILRRFVYGKTLAKKNDRGELVPQVIVSSSS
jgi:uncharacterized protein